ncbi:hypothetical protein M728_005693 (plasmid) [Ensifer sp. WSM1721]
MTRRRYELTDHEWSTISPLWRNPLERSRRRLGGSGPCERLQKRQLFLFRLKTLPADSADLLDLYKYLNAYIERHRGVLLAGGDDPGTFFVKTVKANSRDAAYTKRPSTRPGA